MQRTSPSRENLVFEWRLNSLDLFDLLQVFLTLAIDFVHGHTSRLPNKPKIADRQKKRINGMCASQLRTTFAMVVLIDLGCLLEETFSMSIVKLVLSFARNCWYTYSDSKE